MDQAIELATLSSSDAADWKTICRRLSLALIGNGLSLEDIRVLEKVPEEDRVGWWADYLLSDRRSADYLAERFTRATVGTNNGPFLLFRRRMYVDWIADQIAENVPYDRIVRQLITATGSWTDSPQVNFLTATMDENDQKQPDVIRLAGRTSRAFLAQRIDCLQCHQDCSSRSLARRKILSMAKPLLRCGLANRKTFINWHHFLRGHEWRTHS